MKLHHLALRVKNIEIMLDFYCNKFGFQEAFRIMNDDGSLRIVYVHVSDNQFLELCLGGTNENTFDDKTTLGVRHICFVVDNIEKTRKELVEKQVQFDSEILQMRDKNQAMYLFDPEGNKIEIVEIGEESPQRMFEKPTVYSE